MTRMRATTLFLHLFVVVLTTSCHRCAFAWSSFTQSSSSIYTYSRRSYTLRMGMQVKIRIVGRKSGSEQWLDDAYSMYETRLQSSPLDVETVWHKNDAELIKGVDTDLNKNHVVVLLDPKGTTCTSEVFAEKVFEWLNHGGSRLSFVIGGAEGLPAALLQDKSLQTIRLSDLTFTHQFARVCLTEQIYRATEIKKGSGYHK